MPHLAPLFAGITLFLLNNLAIVSGWLDPPSGYEPMLLNRGSDFAVYVSWSRGFQSQLLLPDYTAPWQTAPAFFNPLPWAIGQFSQLLGIGIPVAYLVFHLLFYVVAAYSLYLVLREFTGTRSQFLLALLIIVASLPLQSLTIIPTIIVSQGFWQQVPLLGHEFTRLVAIATSPRWNAWSPLPPVPGLGDFFWASSDGFFHGISSSVFVTFGTATTLLAFGCIARFLKSRQRRYLAFAALTTFVSALVHPYEVVVIVSAGALTFLLQSETRWRDRAAQVGVLGLAGAAGLAPLMVLALRFQWVHDAAEVNRWVPLAPPRLLFALGLPTILAVALLVIRPRMVSKTDLLLQSWFVCTLVGVFIPWLPWSQHLLDGFHYAVGLLVARQVTQIPLLENVRKAYPRLIFAVLSLWGLLSAVPYVTYYWQSYQDGRLAQPSRLFTTVAPTDEAETIAWLEQHVQSDDLVLAPLDSAPWFATVPMHSFAGHWSYSLTYTQQSHLIEAFFGGSLSAESARQMLADYGVRYVVVPVRSPATSYLRGYAPRAKLGTLVVYELPGNTMKPYPGLPRSSETGMVAGVPPGR